MAGTKAGGEKARQTNIKRHGKDFYKRIGIARERIYRAANSGGLAHGFTITKIENPKGGIKGWLLRIKG